MRLLASVLITWLIAAADAPRPPGKLVFPSKRGDVVFDHSAHAARDEGGCASCHDKLWPQSAKAPLGSSAGCRTCHRAGGKSFETRGNCDRCHAPAKI
jgi:c(7)-type cytochrome triheme protein